MRILSDDEVQRLLSIRDGIAIADRAYRDLAQSRALSPPRINLAMPCRDDRQSALKVWTAADAASGVAAVRMTSSAIDVTRLGARYIGESIPAAPGGMFVGLVILFDLVTTEPLAIIHDARLAQLSISLPVGLAAKYLARRDASVVGLLGAGMQARQQIEAIAAVQPIAQVRVFTPRRRDAEAFAREMEHLLKCSISAVDDRRDAVADCDIVVAASSSPTAIFEADWLRPGTHVSLTRPSEGPSDLVAVATRVCTAAYEEPLNYSLGDAGELWRARAASRHPAAARAVALPDVVAGLTPGRVGPQDITVYGAFGGYSPGLLFAALGKEAYDRATRDGIGQSLPVELFLQARAS